MFSPFLRCWSLTNHDDRILSVSLVAVVALPFSLWPPYLPLAFGGGVALTEKLSGVSFVQSS
jgi:hypothetical protein